MNDFNGNGIYYHYHLKKNTLCLRVEINDCKKSKMTKHNLIVLRSLKDLEIF